MTINTALSSIWKWRVLSIYEWRMLTIHPYEYGSIINSAFVLIPALQSTTRKLIWSILSLSLWTATFPHILLKKTCLLLNTVYNSPDALDEWMYDSFQMTSTAHSGETLIDLQTSPEEKSMLQRICHETPSWKYMESNTYTIARASLQVRFLTNTWHYSHTKPTSMAKRQPADYDSWRMRMLHMMRCPALAQTCVILLQPVLQRMQDISDSPPDDDKDILQVLLSYTSDRLIYNLGSKVCYHLSMSGHLPPLIG